LFSFKLGGGAQVRKRARKLPASILSSDDDDVYEEEDEDEWMGDETSDEGDKEEINETPQQKYATKHAEDQEAYRLAKSLYQEVRELLSKIPATDLNLQERMKHLTTIQRGIDEMERWLCHWPDFGKLSKEEEETKFLRQDIADLQPEEGTEYEEDNEPPATPECLRNGAFSPDALA
jgi:hypothetical protein